jgi:hypothetical protein
LGDCAQMLAPLTVNPTEQEEIFVRRRRSVHIPVGFMVGALVGAVVGRGAVVGAAVMIGVIQISHLPWDTESSLAQARVSEGVTSMSWGK